MIHLKSEQEIEIMRHGGRISRDILDFGLKLCNEGISTMEINSQIEAKFREMNVVPWFKSVRNYPYATQIAVNDEWLHSMPGDYVLKNEDVVSIDLGVKFEGFHLDNCWTIVVNENQDTDIREAFNHSNPLVKDFLVVCSNALYGATEEFREGTRIGNISAKMQELVETKGYSLIDEYAGHGIGKEPHEDPSVPCKGSRGAGDLIKKGLVLAIEVMAAHNSPVIQTDNNGWTVRTKDGSLSCMFEHTVALTEKGPEILTK